MTRPNLFVVGAPKCGTTALFEYLRTHPEISFSTLKEPHYFADDLPGNRDVQTLDDYHRLFGSARPHHKVVGEASVLYLMSAVAIPNIRRYNPAARIIAMVRNPAEMAVSLHQQLVYSFYENHRDFSMGWSLQERRRQGFDIPPGCRDAAVLQYSRTCRLGEQLARLYAHFPREQVHVIVHDDLKRTPLAVYRETLRFLGVSDDGRTSFPTVNRQKRHRVDWLGRWLVSPPAFLNRWRDRMIRDYGTRRSLFSRVAVGLGRTLERWNSAGTFRNPLNTTTRHRLLETFRDDVAHLSDLLGRNLSHEWGFESTEGRTFNGRYVLRAAG
ncbi:MAG: sulfotransferase domain-containing protein [Planctomycetaceae bacterium]|nr:sulfotransferase domain-containing protein [Planctomycetaceae bacterium]